MMRRPEVGRSIRFTAVPTIRLEESAHRRKLTIEFIESEIGLKNLYQGLVIISSYCMDWLNEVHSACAPNRRRKTDHAARFVYYDELSFFVMVYYPHGNCCNRWLVPMNDVPI